MLAIGGYPPLRDVEVIDFGGVQMPAPPKPADLPEDMDGLVAGTVGDQVIVCGGLNVDRCYSLDFAANEWKQTASLDRPRDGAASFVYQGDSMYILGGSGGGFLSTSVIFRDNSVYPAGDLPYPAYYPCVANVNETHVFFAGGASYGGDRSDAYLVEVASWKWSKVDITDRPNVMAWIDRVRARPGVARGLAYGVPEDEIDRWSAERRKSYASGGATIASNERLRSDV